MKTGRRRKKQPSEQKPPETSPAKADPHRPTSPSLAPVGRKKPTNLKNKLLPIILFAFFALVVAALICATCSGPRVEPAQYVPANAEGSWTASIRVLVPQTATAERFRSDCEADPACTILPGTCALRERIDDFSEEQVDEYDDFAYEIYYEETEGKLYEAQGNDFAATQLNQDEDWWDDELHHVAEEWLDEETCQYTQYTTWITDPDDTDYEIEVVLSQCEVWDHVTVYRKVFEQGESCQVEIVEGMSIIESLSQQGSGPTVNWPAASIPADGESEREFKGTVIFRAEGNSYTASTNDEHTYQQYLTVQYYLALDANGNVLRLTDNAP